MEGSVGLIISGLLRVEYVHRFTYRDLATADFQLPNVALGMVRVGVTL